MLYAVEAWAVPLPDDEEQGEVEMVASAEFEDRADALRWLWEHLEEGYFTRLWMRSTS